MTRAVILVALGLFLPSAWSQEKESKIRPPQIQVLDLTGQPADPFAGAEWSSIVFIFVSVDCPISNSYAPELRRLRDEFRGIPIRLVYPIEDQTADAVRKHLKDYELEFEAFRDPELALAREAKARVTPEAAVFAKGQGWVYRGRIDDRNVDFGKLRGTVTHHDLRDVLAALSEGKRVTRTVTRAVGCYIPEAE